MCSYCDHDDGHDIEHCAERLEDKFGTKPAALREGETRDDDNTHTGDIVARQLAEADDETREELEGEREVRTDGGLHDKYTVLKNGEPVESCFVLEPDSDPAARDALATYAAETENDDLAADLREWVAEYRDDADERDCPDCGGRQFIVSDGDGLRFWICSDTQCDRRDHVGDREVRTDGGTRTQPDRLAGWNPNASDSSAPRCQNCEERVLEGTARVFGDNSDTLWHCGSCLSLRDLYHGAGFKPDYDPVEDRGRSSANHDIFGGPEQ